jgi:hypothetical protein
LRDRCSGDEEITLHRGSVERSIRARATCCARSCRLRLWIENDQGERIFYVDGKVLRVRDTVLIKDRTGNELIKLQKRLLGPAIPWPSSAAATQ